jgi:hypothetical protein
VLDDGKDREDQVGFSPGSLDALLAGREMQNKEDVLSAAPMESPNTIRKTCFSWKNVVNCNSSDGCV